MAYFIYNGKDSRDMGVILESLPPITRPKRRMETLTIPGRNGTLCIDEGTYESNPISLKCTLKRGIDPRRITTWLEPFGNITFSDEIDKYYKARIVNSIPLERVFRISRQFILQLELQPFAYGKEKYRKKYLTGITHEFYIPNANTNMFPYIKVSGWEEISLTINDRTMVITPDEYVELDCELQIAYKDKISANDRVYGPFFELKPGENTISIFGNYTELEIVYQKMYI